MTPLAGMGEIEMLTPAASEILKRVDAAVLHHEGIDGFLTAIFRIHIEDEHARLRAGGDAHIRAFVVPPELLNGVRIARGSLLPVPEARMLARRRARALIVFVAPFLAGANADAHAVQRKHPEA